MSFLLSFIVTLPYEMDNQPRKRRRIPKSCQQCRQRKVRCDRQVPCGPCTQSRASLPCTYSQESESLPQPPIVEDEQQSLLDPLQGPGSPSGIQQREPTRERNNWTISDDSAMEQILRDLTGKVQKFEQQLKVLSNDEHPSGNEDEGSSFPTTKPRLLAPASKMKFLGPTHWSHKVDEVCTPWPVLRLQIH